MTAALRFVRTLGAARLAAITVAMVVGALVSGRAAMVVLCAPPLILLVLGHRATRPEQVSVSVRLDRTRAVEGDEVGVTVRVELPQRTDGVEVTLTSLLPVDGPGPLTRTGTDLDRFDARFTLLPDRWGRWSVGRARLSVLAAGGLQRADLTVPLGEIVVYPRTVPLRTPPRPTRLPQLVGEHVVAAKGSGVEFADIRPYQPTDPARLVHWAATARYGRPYVVERHTERLADVVLMIDAYSDVGPPGNSSLDVSVRAAASLATSWLRAGDRVGVVALGGALRWLPVGLGGRYLYRIVDSVVEVRRDAQAVPSGFRRLPPAALPPGALVAVFTPLLDDAIVSAIGELSERGLSILVLNTLTREPTVDAEFPGNLALRVWRRERVELERRLAALGAVTVKADDPSMLDAALAPVHRHRPGGRSR
ncbi:MAG: DUF58 domain-containing protein [Actinocatenispora sp.]